MSHISARHLVENLLRRCPDKATDILVRFFHQDQATQTEILSCLAEVTEHHGVSNPPGSFNITFGSSAPTSPRSIPLSNSPPHRRLPHRNPSNIRHDGVLSPPSSHRTASSVTSYSSKGDRASTGNYIFLLTADESNNVKKHMVRMRTACIKHSVIRDDLVYNHKLRIDPQPATQFTVLLPGHIEVRVSYCVELTWERLGLDSNSTHSTLFFAVPANMLEIDVLLGYEDSGEAPNDTEDYQPTVAPQPRHQPGFLFQEYDQNVRPTTHSPPPPSFHRSTLLYDGSSSHSPVGPHHQFVEDLVEGQHLRAAAAGSSHVSLSSPAATVLDSRSLHAHSHRSSASPIASVHNLSSGSNIKKLRVTGVWNKRTINMWLDPDASSEAFFQAFQQMAAKYKRTFERNMTMIWLRKDEDVPEDDSHGLELAKDTLEADWKTTLNWIHANRSDEPPHLFAMIDANAG